MDSYEIDIDDNRLQEEQKKGETFINDVKMSWARKYKRDSSLGKNVRYGIIRDRKIP
mgnify:CR=1 FL=1|jgi:hypothetical protein